MTFAYFSYILSLFSYVLFKADLAKSVLIDSLGVIYPLHQVMMLWPIVMLLVGCLIGYGIAYTRYGNAKMIDELRSSHKELQKEYHHLEQQLEELLEQNKILKNNAQSLLDQNEDFAKMVSELSRYYYHIKQGSKKVKELAEILGIHDEEMERKLVRITDQASDLQDTNEVEIPNQGQQGQSEQHDHQQQPEPKRFF